MNYVVGSYGSEGGFGRSFLITFAVMIVASWAGFVQPMPTRASTLITLLSGMAATVFSFRGSMIRTGVAIALPLLIYFPVMMCSDVLAHLLFNGCVLY